MTTNGILGDKYANFLASTSFLRRPPNPTPVFGVKPRRRTTGTSFLISSFNDIL